jgi:hypothetical protein
LTKRGRRDNFAICRGGWRVGKKTKNSDFFGGLFFSSDVVFPARVFRAAVGAADGELCNEVEERKEATARSKVLAGFFVYVAKRNTKTMTKPQAPAAREGAADKKQRWTRSFLAMLKRSGRIDEKKSGQSSCE